jgi:prepilin-type N-terminal cleavage/methylation domain-containing protein
MRQRGVSLLELLVVAAMGALLMAGAVRAFQAGIQYQTDVIPRREEQLGRQRFEEGLAKLLRAAYVSPSEQDATTYFAAGSSTGQSLTQDASADTLVFTVLGLPPDAAFFTSVEDFEARNEIYGPQGGPAELQISTSPVGDAGGREGLFLRVQRPSDGDPFQGGFESVLDERVASMAFQFWNGETWVAEWDTTTQGSRRIPAAIRVTYAFEGEEHSPIVFVVRLPLSDVTPENPLGVGGTP